MAGTAQQDDRERDETGALDVATAGTGTRPADLATGAASSMPVGGGGVTGDFGGILAGGALGHLTDGSTGHAGAHLPTDGDPEDPDTAGKVKPGP